VKNQERNSMERLTIEVGPFAVNSSIVHDGRKAYVIDPGAEGERLVSLISSKGLELECILLTHAHFDHIGAVAALKAAFPGAGVFVPPGDLQVYSHPMNQLPPEYPPVKLPEGVLPEFENGAIEVIPSPGHTPGGVCYYLSADKLLFSGDTLFAGSVGRTDLPGGHMPTLMNSLAALKRLPDDTLVIPGHGPATTIGEEKANNPFLQV
jgi:glyoxylase-like metal-dependent hydrolase (beta-lactamase superfamily II)